MASCVSSGPRAGVPPAAPDAALLQHVLLPLLVGVRCGHAPPQGNLVSTLVSTVSTLVSTASTLVSHLVIQSEREL